jgi:AraC family transcriptional regulator
MNQHTAAAYADPAALHGEAPLSFLYIDQVPDFPEPAISRYVTVIVPGESAALGVSYRFADGRERTSTLRSGQVAIIPACREYAVYRARPGDGTTAFDAVLLFLDRQSFDEARVVRGTPEPRPAELHCAEDAFLCAVARQWREAREPWVESHTRSLSRKISDHLLAKYLQPSAQDAGSLTPSRLARAQACIRDHLAETLHVEQIAAAANLSPFHFARLFKKATGQSPHIYLTERRVEHAKLLLRTTDLSLMEVGSRSGFKTQGHFTGVFHRYAGVTPRVFRMAERGDPEGDAARISAV